MSQGDHQRRLETTSIRKNAMSTGPVPEWCEFEGVQQHLRRAVGLVILMGQARLRLIRKRSTTIEATPYPRVTIPSEKEEGKTTGQESGEMAEEIGQTVIARGGGGKPS